MLKQILKVILSVGITSSTRGYLVANLKATSVVNLLLSVVIVFFILLFAFHAPAVVPVMILGLLVVVTSTAVQFMGFHIAARMLTSSLVCLLALTVHNIIANQVGTIIPFTFATCTLLVLSPLYLFSISEMLFASIALAINIIALLLTPYITHLFVLNSDVKALNAPGFQTLILGFGISILCASTIALQSLNRKEALKARTLLKKVEQDNFSAVAKENELKVAIQQLQSSQLEEQKRIWATQGLAQLSRILREETNRQKLSDQLIAFLAKYTKSNQAALFLIARDNGDEHFELRSCYAYDRKKFIEGKIALGEGLLGECYFEKNYVYITEVPKHYTRITSGLGEATPRSILIVPLLTNDVIYGAFEFASFNKYEQHEINFLMEAAENTASIFNTITVNEQTKALLAETQQMAQQMRAQEEEMRQNMEELTATQEQQARSEMDLRASLAERDNEIIYLNKKLALLTDQLQTNQATNEMA